MKFPSLALKSIPSAARAALLSALLAVFLCVPAAWGQVGPAFVIAETLGADYLELMRRAGYVVPGGTAHGNTLAHALSSEGLTAEEAEALTTYLQLLRHKQRQRNA